MGVETSSNRITSYTDFFPYYLREHRRPITRAWHYFGTTMAISVLAGGLATQIWWLAASAFLFGYGPAWVGHFFFEKNRPATFDYPAWSLRADFHMYWLWIIGRLKSRLQDSGAV